MNRRYKGISLIVLVITIIIIVILATAVILSIANNNPIENAKNAVDESNRATLLEAANLAYIDWYSKDTMEGNVTDDALEYVKDALKRQGFSEDEVNKINLSEDGEITIEDNIVANTPVIPNGFEYLTGTVDTGYVIKNSTDGNEFVWVPVDNIDNFKRIDGYSDGALQGRLEVTTEPYQGENADPYEVEEYNEMMKSVDKYNGFYIGRYETGKDSNGKATSLPNQEAWNNIPWKSDENTSTVGAVEASRSLYPKKSSVNTKDAVSTLIYGVQWDATVSYLEEKGYAGISINSDGKGNYGTSEIIYTGSAEHPEYAQNNIYDMCGNLLEWTMEKFTDDSDKRIIRGGSSTKKGGERPISCYLKQSIDMIYSMYGFRIALYIEI